MGIECAVMMARMIIGNTFSRQTVFFCCSQSAGVSETVPQSQWHLLYTVTILVDYNVLSYTSSFYSGSTKACLMRFHLLLVFACIFIGCFLVFRYRCSRLPWKISLKWFIMYWMYVKLCFSRIQSRHIRWHCHALRPTSGLHTGAPCVSVRGKSVSMCVFCVRFWWDVVGGDWTIGLSCNFRFFCQCSMWHVFVLLFFFICGWMFRLVRYLSVINTSAIDCPGRIVSEMTYHVSSGTSDLTD